MGMHSWLCRGCGEELNEGEYGRLDGHKQVYDGYGGGRDYGDDIVVWHQYCYSKASVEQKLDETPSDHAPNQGMGYSHLKFLKGYDETASTKYSITVHCWISPNPEWNFYLTENGLEDENAYKKNLEAIHTEINAAKPKSWYDEFFKIPREEQDRLHREQQDAARSRAGRTSPHSRRILFDSIDDAVKAAEGTLASLPEGSSYHFVIYGEQAEATGAVFVRKVYPQREVSAENKT
jgi:hypothetical protein